MGQLGLQGERANQPIVASVSSPTSGLSYSFQDKVLRNGAWSVDVREGDEKGNIEAVSSELGAITYADFDHTTQGVRTVPIAADETTAPSGGSTEDVARQRYPLSRDVYLYLHRPVGKTLPAPIREFLRFALSREGQQIAVLEGYFPLNATEAAGELRKLR